jgi:hypothetical protein
VNEIRLSPSAINDYQACPRRYLYSYIYHLESEKEKDSLRIGTHWGKCHEIVGMIPQGKCPRCLKYEEIQENCYLCAGTGVLPTDLLDAVMRYLDWAYESIPDGKNYEEWKTEQITILYSFIAYHSCYGSSPFEIVASEIKYDLPTVDPTTHKKILKARSTGRLDHIIRDKNSGLYYVLERKSTSQSLTTSRYWDYLKRNIQTLSYLWAARICQRIGQLKRFGIAADGPLIQGVWYDVWHKPDIAPRRTTKKEVAEWEISHNYYGEGFGDWSDFETPEMYGARLLSDIAERPEHYFARREFAISEKQLEAFEVKQAIQARRIRHDEESQLWVDHEGSCEMPFRCEFYSLCSNDIKIGPNDCPEGFRKQEKLGGKIE